MCNNAWTLHVLHEKFYIRYTRCDFVGDCSNWPHRNVRSAVPRRETHAMSMTKQLPTILAGEIRFYILSLPFCGYAVPGAIAQCCNGELWLGWLDCWASCYIPPRAVCEVFRCLHLGELMYAVKARWTTTVYPIFQETDSDFPTAKPKVLCVC